MGVCDAQGSANIETTPKLVGKTTTGCQIGNTAPMNPGMSAAMATLTVTWSGACVDGWVSGAGVSTIKLGAVEISRYEGEMQHGLFNGQGTYYGPGGITVSGVFRDGKIKGQVAITLAGRGHYEGGWDIDHKEGFGVETEANGLRFEGTFVNGKRNGHGVLTSPKGTRIEAEWKDGVIDGHGSAVSPNNRFDGVFQNNRFNGPGVLVTKSGSRYEGNFRDGLPDGEGTLTKPGAPTVTGMWAHGCLHDGNRSVRFGPAAAKCP